MNFSREDDSWYGYDEHQQGRAAMLHEVGHVLGLGHSQFFDVMRTNLPVPVAGGPWFSANVEPFPDDAAGVRAFYNTSGWSLTNLFVSAQKFDGSAIKRVNADSSISGSGQDEITVHRGDAIDLWYTAVNNGTTNQSNVRFRVFLNNGLVNSPDLFSSTNAVLYSQSYFTEHRTMTIPTSISKGFYYIYWQIDAPNLIGEYREDDNLVHSAIGLNVI